MGLLEVARGHLGDPGGKNTCMKAIQGWCAEAGIPQAGNATWSVSAWRSALLSRSATAAGWTYHVGTDGVQPGDVLDWGPEAHVTVLESINGAGRLRSIGSGGPSNRVALQPTGGGYNPRSMFLGYGRPPGSRSAILGEDDMYDEAAEARLMAVLDTIHKAATPFKEYLVNGTVFLLNPQSGKAWGVPSAAYADLVRALGLSAGPVRDSGQNEIDFMGFLGGSIGDAAPTHLELSAADVADIAGALATTQVVLTADQLAQIAGAAQTSGPDGVRALGFVTIVS